MMNREVDTYQLILERRVAKFIVNLPKKHRTQVKSYILALQEAPIPHDSKLLKGYEPYRRGDCGEYRIIYRLDEATKIIYVVIVGKRNGGEVYKNLKGVLG